jgi:hypothetical protein
MGGTCVDEEGSEGLVKAVLRDARFEEEALAFR